MRLFVPLYIILFILPGSPGLAQSVIFEDGFEDGEFILNPEWTGDTDDFTISNANDNHLLQLNADGAGSSYLSTASTNTVGYWEFYSNLDGFDPSNNNNVFIYLMSDIADLSGQVNGYALQAGENLAGDVFRLFKITNGSKDGEILTGTTNISTGGEYRVKVTRSVSGNWKLEVGTGYTGTLILEDTGIDNDYSGAYYFGFKVTYTKSNIDNFAFDFRVDIPPLTITEISANANQVDVSLNRPCDPGTVQAQDFSINNGIGTPASFSIPEPGTISLTYTNPLPGGTYTLTIQNIADLNGEEIAPTNTSFIKFDTFAPGDVIINEFMYDPPAGAAEYVELKNTSDKYLDIKHWQLGDNNALNTITGTTYALEPDGYLVISADTTALFSTFGHRPYVQMSSFPALNNTGDAVWIVSPEGEVADSLTYAPSWGGTDVAVERRSGSVPALYPKNWAEAPGGSGSPGRPNSTLADGNAPAFERLAILSDTSLYLEFSERIEPEGAALKSNYTLMPKRNIDDVLVERAAVTLLLAQPLRSGQNYRVRVEDLQDVFGNVMSPAVLEQTYIRFAQAQKGDIVINEILYTREDGGDPEFIELYNPTGNNFNLSGWKLGDAAGTATLGPDIQLQAGGYMALTDNTAFADSLSNVLYLAGFPSLNDTGDAVYLQTDTGLTIDSLFYHSDWDNTAKGISLERKDPLAASNDPSNWQSHPASAGYSPGMENTSFQPDESSPDVIFSKLISGNRFEVQFSEFIILTPELSFSLGNLPLSIESFNPTRADRIILRLFPEANATETTVTLMVQNLTDVRGNFTPVAGIPVAYQLEPSSVVINEIMYNPLNDPDDNLPDQSEYVELRNTKDYAVSLEGLHLHDAPDEDGEVRSLIPVTTAAKWIPARGVALIYADEAPVFEQSRIADFFGIGHPNTASTIRIDKSSLSLASSGDAVYLSDSTGTVIDSVYYDESWQNPNLIDTRGIALERINPSGLGADRTNWSSSTNEKGGTPHAENTLYQIPDQAPDQTGISFSPNPFSPDNDGFDDNLFINYRLDEADYLMKVRIYDRYGRLVRKLADGQPAGFEGALIWDGRKDDGTRNRIGIYIVVFEAFNSANGKNRAFKKTVVLARRL